MTGEISPMGRRGFLRMSLAAAAMASTGGMLSACGSSSTGNSGSTGAKSADNPFGVGKNSSVDAVIFDGGYKTDYFTYAGDLFQKQHGGSVKLTPTTKISQTLQPRFIGGNPPDIIDNSGADAIPLTTIVDQAADLNDLIQAKNLEGTTIKDTLFSGVLDSTTVDNKLAGLNYVMTVYALWYSQALFDKFGWKPPTTWEEALALGAEAKKQGKYLFCWGKEAANYYLTVILDSAIKEGGDEVRVALGNLEKNSWSHPAVQGALNGLKKIVDAGYVKPGGAGTQFTAAQAQWTLKQEAILYPSGSWIEAEMKDQTAPGFEMVGVPSPAVSSNPKLGLAAVRGSASELYMVPAKAKNQAAGKELLRIMLSKDAATNFAKTKLALPVVKLDIPEDGFGSTALKAQSKMLSGAGDGVFDYTFTGIYGFGTPSNVAFNSFLAGDMSIAELTKAMQDVADKVREDGSIKKVRVS
ncbi:N-acetylglucosamine/diacetylchitobiose ABC transporter substrate-binding protein [Micromonospora sp. LZ34]